MQLTLPDEYRDRIAILSAHTGLSVEEYVCQILDEWLSWREAEPAILEALNGPPAEPLASDEFDSIRDAIRQGRLGSLT